jgi:CobQ-like glutamine amidotransferase family enzyme
MSADVLALFPELTDVNGDAQNALVLARRAQWAGEDVSVVGLPIGGRPAGTPTVIVLGSGVDAALPRLRDALESLRGPLTEWLDAGVPLLAVGTGMELLGSSLELTDRELEGLGVLPGVSRALPQRVAGDLVVRTHEGVLVGYENHGRAFHLDPGAVPFGTVLTGAGDGGTDGVRHGSIVGTRLHGPVLAKNPALADALLAAAFGRAVVPDGEQVRAADAAAARIRQSLLAG